MSAIHSLVSNQGNGYGPQLIVNGDFLSSSGWTLGSCWSIDQGLAFFDPAYTGSDMYQYVSDQNDVGNTYQISVDISSGSGTLYFTLFGHTSSVTSSGLSTPGTNVVNLFLPSGHGDLERVKIGGSSSHSDYVFTIDNVSVRRYYP